MTYHGGKPAGGRRADWETPPGLFARLNSVFRFDLDVCALPDNAKCAKFFAPIGPHTLHLPMAQLDGLTQAWAPHVCWLNPPYGRGLSAWLRKAVEESNNGATVVALLPCDQSTRWFHDYVKPYATIFPLDGRVKFVGAEGSPNFGSMVAIYWPRGFWDGHPHPRGH
jgi:phage N-6-adenine-methyltransferase